MQSTRRTFYIHHETGTKKQQFNCPEWGLEVHAEFVAGAWSGWVMWFGDLIDLRDFVQGVVIATEALLAEHGKSIKDETFVI
ncbi:hypothetical protein Droror1_Dr00008261 [Drosera rotundifolia]